MALSRSLFSFSSKRFFSRSAATSAFSSISALLSSVTTPDEKVVSSVRIRKSSVLCAAEKSPRRLSSGSSVRNEVCVESST